MMAEMSQTMQTHPDLFTVVRGFGEFSSCLKARQRFEAGSVIVRITGVRTATRHYTTLQCGPSPEDNIRVDSELVYVNHSCAPNTAFDLSSDDPSKWHVRALRTIEAGDDITFFYPSTEWEMDQPFACRCGAVKCLGTVRGSKFLSLEELLERGSVSPWVVRLASKLEQERARTK